MPLGLLVLLASPVQAGTPLPWGQALETSRAAAEAVIKRSGSESCLRGKITNAMVGLSDSCDAAGRRDALCSLADQVVVDTNLSMASMDEAATKLLKLTVVNP
jgi:hypothetical protein